MKTKYLFLVFLWYITNTLSAQKVINGAEQMDKLLPLLEGKQVALVVNHTSMTGNTHLLDTLVASGVKVAKVFAPEHGFRGNADAGETIKNGKDIRTGVPIFSLYGKNKKPTAEQMRGVDVVVFDIQDVGARFYTYISTMHYVMEACAENGKPLIITDRPNPCDYVDGPIRQKDLKSFVSMHAIPVLHGCTVGELAQMINGEGWLAGKRKCELTVIPVEGWKHGQPYSLPVKPSPNLPNNQAIALYPSLCPFEGTAISVGRGTHHPFQVIGSPDIQLSSFRFQPQALEGFDKNPMYKDRYCYGNNLRSLPAPKGFSLKYVLTYYQTYKKMGKADKFFTRPQWFDILLGNHTVRQQIIQGATEEEIRAGWQEEVEQYKKMRGKYLLYEE
ncbi:exo-beta-N-acetylmuramidase NamZ family protein [Phocaeicola sp.]